MIDAAGECHSFGERKLKELRRRLKDTETVNADKIYEKLNARRKKNRTTQDGEGCPFK